MASSHFVVIGALSNECTPRDGSLGVLVLGGAVIACMHSSIANLTQMLEASIVSSDSSLSREHLLDPVSLALAWAWKDGASVRQVAETAIGSCQAAGRGDIEQAWFATATFMSIGANRPLTHWLTKRTTFCDFGRKVWEVFLCHVHVGLRAHDCIARKGRNVLSAGIFLNRGPLLQLQEVLSCQ